VTTEISKGAVASTLASLCCFIIALSAANWSSVWLVIGTVGFGWEAVTLQRRQKGDTLSETIWKLPIWGRILLGIFFVWLAFHFGWRV
jgi:hypothetical protein